MLYREPELESVIAEALGKPNGIGIDQIAAAVADATAGNATALAATYRAEIDSDHIRRQISAAYEGAVRIGRLVRNAGNDAVDAVLAKV